MFLIIQFTSKPISITQE